MAETTAVRSVRRENLRIALETAVDPETITLAELADVWGVGKPAFVNVRDRIADFPAAVVNGKLHLYPRRGALLALQRYERRHDVAQQQKQDRLAAIIGVPSTEGAALSVTELQKAMQLRADIEARMVMQGDLVPRAEMRASASRVFQIFSKALAGSSLSAAIDPNGIFGPEVRAAADEAGKALLLRIHAQMAHMLAGDGTSDRTAGSDGVGAAARRARPASTRSRRQ